LVREDSEDPLGFTEPERTRTFVCENWQFTNGIQSWLRGLLDAIDGNTFELFEHVQYDSTVDATASTPRATDQAESDDNTYSSWATAVFGVYSRGVEGLLRGEFSVTNGILLPGSEITDSREADVARGATYRLTTTDRLVVDVGLRANYDYEVVLEVLDPLPFVAQRLPLAERTVVIDQREGGRFDREVVRAFLYKVTGLSLEG
jgi:hypothetical protein